MTECEKRLEELASKNPTSDWVENATWRQNNYDWLDMSARIALRILRTMREQNITKQDLSNASGIEIGLIGEILKGSENLTIREICRLEEALKTKLVDLK